MRFRRRPEPEAHTDDRRRIEVRNQPVNGTGAHRAPRHDVTLTSLLAVAVVADRLLFLRQVGSASTPPEPAAITASFEDAFEAQRHA
jgi:hypothetical protein